MKMLDLLRNLVHLLNLRFFLTFFRNFFSMCLHIAQKILKKTKKKSSKFPNKVAYAKDPLYKSFFLLFFCLSSCLRMSEEERRKNWMEVPSLESSVENSLQTDLFTLGSFPKASWWEDFGSDQLNQMVLEAIEKNPSIQSVKEKIERAKEVANVAKSKLYPLITFNADGFWQMVSNQGLQRAYNSDFPKHADIVDVTLNFTYEFDFWNRYRNLFHAALSREEEEKALLAQIELITATSLARSYFALRANLAKKEVYEELFCVRKKLWLLHSLLLMEAIDDLRIVLSSKEKVEEAQKWLYAIQEEIEIDQHLVNILMGKGPDSPLEVEKTLPEIDSRFEIPENLSLELLSRRPDLMAQIWRLEALAHEVGAAKADFFPNINLSAFLGLSSVIYNLLFSSSSYEQGILPTLSLPVYTAGEIQANLDAKRAEYQTAVFEYNNMILKSAEEVVNTLSFAKAISLEKLQQEMIVGQAALRLSLAQDRLRSGLDNALQTLQRKEELLQQEIIDIDLRYDRYVAFIALIRSLGGGYIPCKE